VKSPAYAWGGAGALLKPDKQAQVWSPVRAISGGLIAAVSDDEILAAYQMLAEQEGVFVEPASAASVAGLLKLTRPGQLERGALAVCVLTGHGLKDPETALKRVPDFTPIPAQLEAVLSALQQ